MLKYFLFISVLLILLINCAHYETYRVEEWDSAFLIDSVTLGAIQHSYNVRKSYSDNAKTPTYSDTKLILFEYDIKQEKLKEVVVLLNDINSIPSNPNSFYHYPWLLYTSHNNSDIVCLYNLNTKVNKTLSNGASVELSRDGQYAIFGNQSKLFIYDIPNEKIIHTFSNNERFLFINSEEKKVLFINNFKRLISFDLNSGNRDTLVEFSNSIDIRRITNYGKTLTIRRKDDKLAYFSIDSIYANPQIINNYENFPFIDFEIKKNNADIDVSNGYFVYQDRYGWDIYLGNFIKSDTAKIILDGFQRIIE